MLRRLRPSSSSLSEVPLKSSPESPSEELSELSDDELSDELCDEVSPLSAGAGLSPLSAGAGLSPPPQLLLVLVQKLSAGAGAETSAGAGAETSAGAGAETLAGAGAETLAGAGAETLAGAGAETLGDPTLTDGVGATLIFAALNAFGILTLAILGGLMFATA